MGWILFNADIENFKSVKKLSLQIHRGFSVISGPNGSGKSNILEAIAFGLGGTPTDMRVKCIGELSGDAEKTNRILVKLSFSQYPTGQEIISISSSFANGQRIYYLSDKKATKSKFDEFILNTLGFGNETAYWNISQRAVQNIIIASPVSLYNAVCDVAGTQPLLASKKTAENQIEMCSQQIEVVAKAINELELMVTKDNQLLLLLQQKQQNKNDQSVLLQKLASLQSIYECAVKYQHVLAAMEAQASLQQSEKDIIHLESQLQETICNEKNLAFQQLEKQHQQLLNKLNTATILHRTHHSELQLHLQDKQERAEERKQAMHLLNKLQTELVRYREQYLALTTTILPELRHKVTTIQCKMSNLEESAPVNNEAAKELILDRKSKELNDTVDLHRNTELLVMTLTSTATQSIARLNHLETDLDCLHAQKQELMQLLHRLREEEGTLALQEGGREGGGEGGGISEIAESHQTLHDAENRLRDSWAKLQQCQNALHLPVLPSAPTSQGSPNTYTSTCSICEGDLGFLADIITTKSIITLDGCDTDSSSFSLALSTLLANNLSVRVCRDQTSALEIMKFSERHKLEMRIWPLRSLVSYPRHENYPRLTQPQPQPQPQPGSGRHRSRAIDPLRFLELVQHHHEPRIEGMLHKVAGSWVVIESEEDVSQLIRERGIQGCITLDGNRHTLGSLTIGSRAAGSKQCTVVHRLREYHSLKQCVADAYQRLEMNKKTAQQEQQRAKLKIEISEVSNKIERLHEELTVTTANTAEQRDLYEAQNKKLTSAASSLEEIERKKVQLQEEFAVLRRVDDFASRQELARQQDLGSLRRLLQTQKEQEGRAAQLCQCIMEHEMETRQLEGAGRKETEQQEEKGLIAVLQEREKHALVELQQVTASLREVQGEVQSMEGRRLELQLAQDSHNDKLTKLRDAMNDRTILLHKHIEDLGVPREKASKEYFSTLLKDIEHKILVSKEKGSLTVPVPLAQIDSHTVESLRADLVHTKASLEVAKKKERDLQQSLKAQSGDYGVSTYNDDAQLYSQLVQKSALLKALNDKLEQIRTSIALLQEDIIRVNGILTSLHSQTYHALRERCRKYFRDLVPDKHVKLAMLTNKLEDGLEFLLYNDDAAAAASGRHLEGRSVRELSGGQKALLGLSFVFAAALHRKRSPLYLLDEVDAALDETNQRAIAKIIAQIFHASQVICVSHHSSFQDQADSTVSVIMKNGATVMVDSITNS